MGEQMPTKAQAAILSKLNDPNVMRIPPTAAELSFMTGENVTTAKLRNMERAGLVHPAGTAFNNARCWRTTIEGREALARYRAKHGG